MENLEHAEAPDRRRKKGLFIFTTSPAKNEMSTEATALHGTICGGKKHLSHNNNFALQADSKTLHHLERK